MKRLDYKDAPEGMLAVASTMLNCTNCDGWTVNNYCRFTYDSVRGQCSKYMRPDKCDVVFVPKSSEAYREAGLFNFDRALDEIVARAKIKLLVNAYYLRPPGQRSIMDPEKNAGAGTRLMTRYLPCGILK